MHPNGYNIREGGNLTGKYYAGQLNPASKSIMGENKIKEKTLKGLETKKRNNTLYVPGRKLSKKELQERAYKSHQTQKIRGTDKIRIRNAHNTLLKNNSYIEISKKSAQTIKDNGLLKGLNNPKSKYLFVAKSPDDNFLLIKNNKEFCNIYDIPNNIYNKLVMRNNIINKWFKINLKNIYKNRYTTYVRENTKNIDFWSFIKINKEVIMNLFENFELNVELVDDGIMPTRATKGDVGLDFYTPIDIVIKPNEDALIPLGVKTAFPEGYALVFMEKSGVSVKKKCDILAKVIDPGYRGVVHAHLFNNSNQDAIFKKGDKVVQGVVFPVWTGVPQKVEEVENNTERGTGGFGSTGDKK